MRRPHRFYTAGILSTAAFFLAASPLSAGNVTSGETLTITPATVNGDVTFTDVVATPDAAVKKVFIDAARGTANFTKGVNITNADMEMKFNGSVTFDLTDAASGKTLDINRLILEGAGDAEPGKVFAVKGDKLALGANTIVTVDKNLTMAFTGGGAMNIPELRVGENQNTALSAADNTIVTAAKLFIGAPTTKTTLNGGLHIGTLAADANFPKGFNVTDTDKSITVQGSTVINGKLSGGGGTNFVFAEESPILLGTGAIGSVLENNTKLTIDDKLLTRLIEKEVTVTSFKPFDVANADVGVANTFKVLAASLDVDPQNLNFRGGGDIAYDKDNGYLVFADYKGQEEMGGVPGYGVPFVKALDGAVNAAGANPHRALAVAIKGVAKGADISQDINTIMGNVPNAALAASLSGNTNQVMRHLNTTLSPAMPGFGGPSGAPSGLWVTPSYSMADIKGSPDKGYGDLEITNPGVTIGYDRWVNERIKLGIFAAMSQPKSEGDFETINSDNLQAGLYGQAQLNYGINVNMALSYSRQSHDAERKIPQDILAGTAPFAAQSITSSFDGDTLSAAVEVSRLYPVGANSFVRPTFGYSYVSTSIGGYTEKSDAAAPGDALSQKVEGTDMTMHLVRLGAEGGWSNDLTTVTGRLFWVGNLGDTQPRTQATLISGESLPFTLTGAEYDQNMVNIGLGVNYVPPQTQGLTLGLNYDALLGSKVKNHSLSLMMRYEF